MESVQWILVESNSPQPQATQAARPAVSVPGKQVSGENAQSDRQAATADAMYAAFTWLFGSGCF
jgi:hypothetical protein